jgi:ketosteroid isomerase-like protein
MRLPRVAVCLGVAGAVALGSTAGKAADDGRQGVVDARARLIRAMEANDVDGIMSSLTADHVTMAPDEPALADARALRVWHERRVAGYTMKGTWAFDDLHVEGDAAVDSWHAVLTLTPKAGGAPASMAAKGVQFWRRERDGRWRLARSIWNNDGPARAVDYAAEKAAIDKVLADQLEGTNRGGEAGADGYVSIVTDDVVLLPPHGPRESGRKAAREWVLARTSAKDWSARWKADRVDVAASGDLAHAFGAYELSYEDAGGNAIRDKGKFLDTFRKQANGQWRETVVMFNSDLPVAGGSGR